MIITTRYDENSYSKFSYSFHMLYLYSASNAAGYPTQNLHRKRSSSSREMNHNHIYDPELSAFFGLGGIGGGFISSGDLTD